MDLIFLIFQYLFLFFLCVYILFIIAKLVMSFLPTLRRKNIDYQSAQKKKSYSTVTQLNRSSKDIMVPQAFFEECRSHYTRKSGKPINGALNTSQFAYPKQICDEIRDNELGEIFVKDNIFCFIQVNKVWFWRYKGRDLSIPSQIYSQKFQKPITGIDWQISSQKIFQKKDFLLIAIAFGTKIQFYELENFTIIKQFSVLKQTNVRIMTLDIVNFLKIQMEYSKSREDDNSLIALWGDDKGNLNLFDFKKRRKYQINDSFFNLRIPFKVTDQHYCQIKQIVRFKNFYYICLTHRKMPKQGIFKQLLQNFGLLTQQNQFITQYTLDIYKVKTKFQLAYLHSETFCNNQITGFVKYKSITVNALINKIKNSYNGYFQRQNSNMIAVSSIAEYNGGVDIVFNTGQSIRIDENFAFVGEPQSCPMPPLQFCLFKEYHCMHPPPHNKIENIKKSYGKNLIVFQKHLISFDNSIVFYSPYCSDDSIHQIRDIVELGKKSKHETKNPNQYLLLGRNTMILVQKITPQSYLLLMGAFGCKDEIVVSPNQTNIKKKLENLVKIFGPVQIIVWILQLFVAQRMGTLTEYNLRIDLYNSINQQFYTDQILSLQQVYQLYKQNTNFVVQNQFVFFNKEVEEYLWSVILMIEEQRVAIPNLLQVNLRETEAICMSFQTIISEIFHPIKNWNSHNFAKQRNKIYHILTLSKTIKILLQKYMEIDTQKNKRTFIDFNSSKQRIWGIGTKGKFCQFCIQSLQKITIILQLYDYVCETDITVNKLPILSQLLFNFNIQNRINFSTNLLNSFALNNQLLINKLIETIPQLEINTVRNFHIWCQFHNNPTNSTSDSILMEEDFQQLFVLMNPYHYEQIERKYLQTKQFKSQQLIKKFIQLCRINCRKINQLQQSQVALNTLIENYKKMIESYYSTLQLPNLDAKKWQNNFQINFYKQKIKDILQMVFNYYRNNIFSKVEISMFVNSVLRELRNDMKEELRQKLIQYNLKQMTQSFKNMLFVNNMNNGRNWSMNKSIL